MARAEQNIRAFKIALLGFSLATGISHGQASFLGNFNPVGSNRAGVHLYGASLASSYSSGGFGIGLTGLSQSPDSKIGVLQGSAMFGWSRPGQKSSFSIVYSPSYVRGVYQSSYRSLNHSFGLSAGRTLSSKWALSGSANGIISDFSQLLFASTRYGNVAGATATFDELFAALLTGNSTNAGLTQVVNAPPVLSSPERAFLYGDRILSASASVSLSYAHSSRSSFAATFSGARAQQFNAGTTASTASSASAIPRTSTGGANFSWSYSLTPRTTLGASVSSARSFSSFQDAYSTQTSISAGRTLNRNWFVQGSAGVGFIRPVRSTLAPTQKPQQVFGGMIGYKFYAHTLVASYTRSISDVYGFGANATEAATGSWAWQRPGRSVSVSGSFGYSRLVGPSFLNSRSWMANGGVGKSLGANLGMSVGFSYAEYPRSILMTTQNLKQTGLIATLGWSPSRNQ